MQGLRYQVYGNGMRDAAELLAWRGYDNVRAAELARAARLSVGSLYRQYGSKRAFALAVRDFMDHELSNYGFHHFFWARGEPEGNFRSAFRVLWRQLAEVVVSQPALFCFTFLHWHPEDLQQPQAQVTRARALVRDVLTEGEREGALAPGATKVGESLIWGALTELARTVVQGTEEVREGDILESGEALLRALAPREGAGPRGDGGAPSGGVEPEAPTQGGGAAGSAQGRTETTADAPVLAVEAAPRAQAGTTMDAPVLAGEVAPRAQAVTTMDAPVLAGEAAPQDPTVTTMDGSVLAGEAAPRAQTGTAMGDSALSGQMEARVQAAGGPGGPLGLRSSEARWMSRFRWGRRRRMSRWPVPAWLCPSLAGRQPSIRARRARWTCKGQELAAP